MEIFEIDNSLVGLSGIIQIGLSGIKDFKYHIGFIYEEDKHMSIFVSLKRERPRYAPILQNHKLTDWFKGQLMVYGEDWKITVSQWESSIKYDFVYSFRTEEMRLKFILVWC